MLGIPYYVHLFSMGSFLFGVVLAPRLLRERRAPSSTAAWLLVMLLLPPLGVPLYLIFGVRKLGGISSAAARSAKRALYPAIAYPETSPEAPPLERLLLAAGSPPRSEGNRLRLIDSGTEAFEETLRLIRGARRRLYLETYVLKLDEVGQAILTELVAKARVGVEVRLLLDGLGSLHAQLHSSRFQGFREAGGQVAWFQPLLHIPFRGQANLRNHRKILIADTEGSLTSQTAIIGGMNLAREYLGPNPEPGRWTDLATVLEGDAVADLERIFRSDWSFAVGEELAGPGEQGRAASPSRAAPDLLNDAAAAVQIVASGPDVAADPLYDALVSASFGASRRIWIATPYFIPDETLSKALELAAARGVDVQILVPRRSNHPLADLCRMSYLSQIQRTGGRVRYFEAGMMHAKAVIIDELCAVVGSANFDLRSLLLNCELGVFLYSLASIREVSRWFEVLAAQTVPAKLPQGWRAEVFGGLGRLLGPQL